MNISKIKPVYALIDGNSFYASCQIAFAPSLKHRPVVILSNNDGCVVAANDKAKALNEELMKQVGSLGAGGFYSALPENLMFQPYFKLKTFLEKHQAVVFSSNYELYGDMSQRMHKIVGSFGKRQEIYSIDESFLDLTGMSDNLTSYGEAIKKRVYQWTSLPVAVGIAYSKTQAKLANHLAKKTSNNVMDLTSLTEADLDKVYADTSVSKIWGVGRQLNKRLQADGINTVLDFKRLNPSQSHKRYSILVKRMIQEINGEACLGFEAETINKQQIMVSRSFGSDVLEYVMLEQAVCNYVVQAAQKLRNQSSMCQQIHLFISTIPFKNKLESNNVNNQHINLIYPSDNSILLIKLAKRMLRKMWRPQMTCHKAGVILTKLTAKNSMQLDLFAPDPIYSDNKKSEQLIKVTDRINKQFGKNTLFLGSMGSPNKQIWKAKSQIMSGRFTTRWDEILCLNI